MTAEINKAMRFMIYILCDVGGKWTSRPFNVNDIKGMTAFIKSYKWKQLCARRRESLRIDTAVNGFWAMIVVSTAIILFPFKNFLMPW